MFKVVVFMLAVHVCLMAFADSNVDQAIDKTSSDLANPSKREEFSKISPDAKKSTQNVHDLAGSKANEDEMYKLSAEVMGNFKGKSQEEILKLVEEAQKNPEAFAKTWTPEQQKKLKEISERVPAANQKSP